MYIDIGSYVKQHLFDEVYRYGIVVAMGTGPALASVKVVWTPRKEHPVANGPYTQSINIEKLEVVRE